MAEIQTSNQAGEHAAQFIEFVMMQAQNASLFLGLIPNPQSGQPEVNLDLARLFIDQLAMIGEKTRGNLSSDETKVLRNALTNLQMAYFEVSQGGGAPAEASSPDAASNEVEETPVAAPASEPAASAAPAPTASSEESRENKKRFSKSYGS